jgi:hypothetical protein
MSSSRPEKLKPGPKGKVLEPYAKEVLLRAREGQSMQEIVNWLARPPREVVISRQAVHQWVQARIRKLAKLNTAFAGTGVSAPFQWETPAGVSPPSQKPMEAHPAQAPPVPTPAASRSPPLSEQDKRTDMTDFMVSDADLSRVQNPLLKKR